MGLQSWTWVCGFSALCYMPTIHPNHLPVICFPLVALNAVKKHAESERNQNMITFAWKTLLRLQFSCI